MKRGDEIVGDRGRPRHRSRHGESPQADSGPFGNLTLQKAHATGHAVWLQLREQGVKVLSNELIHERRAPYQPDMTYFRGDTTRGICLEKIDREPIETEDRSSRTPAVKLTASPGSSCRATDRRSRQDKARSPGSHM